MSETSKEIADDSPAPVTDRVHHNSWSANLELSHHADSVERVIEDAVTAIEHTAPGYHVNIVTHGAHGHPSTYLHERLEGAFGDREIRWEYVERCGCGGHVTRVHVGSTDGERRTDDE